MIPLLLSLAACDRDHTPDNSNPRHDVATPANSPRWNPDHLTDELTEQGTPWVVDEYYTTDGGHYENYSTWHEQFGYDYYLDYDATRQNLTNGDVWIDYASFAQHDYCDYYEYLDSYGYPYDWDEYCSTSSEMYFDTTTYNGNQCSFLIQRGGTLFSNPTADWRFIYQEDSYGNTYEVSGNDFDCWNTIPVETVVEGVDEILR